MKTVIIKQLRLFILWIYYTGVVITLFNYTIEEKITSSTDEELTEGYIRYIDCVYGDPDDTDCKLTDYIDYPNFATIYSMIVSQYGLPIVVFLVFGARKSMLLFWKEYIQYMWKNKTITFQFNPSFDSVEVSKSAIRTLDTEDENQPRERIHSTYIKTLKSRIKEI